MAEIQDLKEVISMVFTKNANITSENFNLHGDRIEILVKNENAISSCTSDLNSIKEIHAIDNASFSQRLNNGKADKISIYPTEKLLILEGSAEVSDAENGTVYGERLTLNNKNKSIKTDGLGTKRSAISIDDLSKFKGTNISKKNIHETANQE